MRIGLVALALIAAVLWTAPDAHAQKRVALVIGNSAYKHAGELVNPKNDATDIAAALKKHGFEVVEGFDLDKVAFERKVRDFSAALKGAEAGLFFYAGHGLQVGGHNYLVPVDAKAEAEDALDWEMLKVDLVHRAMERSTNTNILFLDACRDNPLARNLARAMGTRSSSVGRGLATIELGVGTLISFSTQPGNVAADGTGRNSPFAGALVKQLSSSTDDLSAMLISVRNDVMKETQRKQVPWEHSALTGRFYFGATVQTGTQPKVESGRLSEAAEAWAAVKDSSNVAVLEAYIARYKDTFYAELSRARIEEVKKQQVVVARAPSEQQTAIKVGDIIEQWRTYHPASEKFFEGQNSSFRGTKWKVRDILPSGLRLELVEGIYLNQQPGYIEQFVSSDNFKRRFPSAVPHEQFLREFRKVSGG